MERSILWCVYIENECAIIAYPSIKMRKKKLISESLVQQSESLKTICFFKKYL